MIYHRLCQPLETNSFFLFGARGTGKTKLIKHILPPKDTIFIDLLDNKTFKQHSTNFGLLEELLKNSKTKWVSIDEIQKLPYLLDQVHRLIESTDIKFALTGSSSRKLKRGGANLLAGRAYSNYLHPLTAFELDKDFDLDTVLSFGSLPKVYLEDTDIKREEFLYSYVDTYLKEEIKEEQIIRKIEPFSIFLNIMAASNGEIINSSKIGKQSMVSSVTIEKYLQILVDTLIGFILPPHLSAVRQRIIAKSKFYFFDLGIKRALQSEDLKIRLTPSNYAYGKAFEHFFILECLRLNQYFRKRYTFSYIKTQANVEIDLIISRGIKPLYAIEIKSSSNVDAKDFSGALKLAQDLGLKYLHIASKEENIRHKNNLVIMPWGKILEMIFSNTPK